MSIPVKLAEMTVEEFLLLCRQNRWFFTITWVIRKLNELDKLERQG